MGTPHSDFNHKITEQSFTWLFDNYWEKIYELCYQQIRSHEDARELTQNIFESIWKRRNELHIDGNPEHYLMRSAKLQIINFYRDTKIREEHQAKLSSTYRDFDNCTENEILFSHLNQRVSHVIETLPGQCKLVYQLSKNKHLSNKDVAATLNISIKTVEYHLSNANSLLKRSLKEFI